MFHRVMEISTVLGNRIRSFYEREKAICPPVVSSQRLQLTILTITQALQVHMMHLMELGLSILAPQ